MEVGEERRNLMSEDTRRRDPGDFSVCPVGADVKEAVWKTAK